MSKMLVVWPLGPTLTFSLSEGTRGIPLHVRKGDPKSVTVGGGRPRNEHSRPKAAMARGCARKNAGSFQTFEMSSSKSSGVGAPARVEIRIEGAAFVSKP